MSRFPRKLILMFSMVGMALCYAVLGACFYVKRQQAGNSSQDGFSTAEFEHGWLPPLAIGTSQTREHLYLSEISPCTLNWYSVFLCLTVTPSDPPVPG